MKKCINCGEIKDNWNSFTKTNDDGTHYEVDICKFCRMGGETKQKERVGK